MPNTERADATLAEILALFTSGEFPEKIERTVIHRLESDAPSARWSLGNQLLMLIHGSEDARGFKQWIAAGRAVRKGEKSFAILGPSTRKIETKDAETGETETRAYVAGFHTIPVFDITQTEGEPLPPPADYTPATLPPLREVADALGLTVSYQPFAGRFYGFYRPSEKAITLVTTDIKTWFHELAHAAEDSIHALTLGQGQDPRNEITAEVVAITLCRLYGFEGWEWHGADYVRHYARGTDPAKAAMKLVSRIQAALYRILALADDAAGTTSEPAPEPIAAGTAA